MAQRLLEAKLDQLYAADPEEFVAVRKQLQGELRAAGNKPEAALLGRARRPSTAMWAVNQAVRRHPDLIDAFLARSDELRAAQTGGDRDALRAAIRAHRTALAAVTEAATEVLGARANDAFREEIVSVLRAASTQPELGGELRAGRLVRSDDLLPAFPEFAGFTPEPRATRAKPAGASAERDTKGDTRGGTKRDDATEAAARAAVQEARAELDRARADEAAADAEVAAAQRRVDELDEQLTDARRELSDAKSRLRAARWATARLARRAR
jgi:hypothetical protein